MFHQNIQQETKETANSLFGPIGKEACLYFYVLEIFSFIGLVIAFIHMLHGIFTNKNYRVLGGVRDILNAFILYFINRLLYSMCVH
jgi:hypothetical protein